jgi:predicted acyltransferase
MLQLFTYVFYNSAFINRTMILLTIHRRSRLVIEVIRLLVIVLVLINWQNHLATPTKSIELRLELNLLLHSTPASKQLLPIPSGCWFFNYHVTDR